MSVPGFDHGILNLPLDKRGGGSLDAQIDRNLARIRAEKDAARRLVVAENRERNAPVPFTRAELENAVAVRTRSCWHPVVRVNTKSVTVGTEWSWNDRIPVERILEVRA